MKHHYTTLLDETEFQVELTPLESGYSLKLGEVEHRFELLLETSTLFSFLIDGSHVLEADAAFHQDRCELNVKNIPYHLEVFDPRRRLLSQSDSASSGGLIVAPMPGKIVEIKVKVGDEVEKGQAILVIEAMKMQNELNASMAGIVQEVAIQSGTAVEADQKLVLIVAKTAS